MPRRLAARVITGSGFQIALFRAYFADTQPKEKRTGSFGLIGVIQVCRPRRARAAPAPRPRRARAAPAPCCGTSTASNCPHSLPPHLATRHVAHHHLLRLLPPTRHPPLAQGASLFIGPTLGGLVSAYSSKRMAAFAAAASFALGGVVCLVWKPDEDTVRAAGGKAPRRPRPRLGFRRRPGPLPRAGSAAREALQRPASAHAQAHDEDGPSRRGGSPSPSHRRWPSLPLPRWRCSCAAARRAPA